MPADTAAEIEAARRALDGSEVDYEATMEVRVPFCWLLRPVACCGRARSRACLAARRGTSAPTLQPASRPPTYSPTLHANHASRAQAKLRIARAVFDRFGDADMAGEPFTAFFASARHWLRPYAAFLWLRRVLGTGEHWRWGALATPSQEVRPGGWQGRAGRGGAGARRAAGAQAASRLAGQERLCRSYFGRFRLMLHVCTPSPPPPCEQDLDRLTDPGQEWHRSLRFTYWLQWQLHRQLAAASEYAASRHVALKGDLPIGAPGLELWVGGL